MSRIKTTADYFSHDCDMRNDNKILNIRDKFGITGYGVWCMLLEYLCNSKNLKIENKQQTITRLAKDFEVKESKLTEILNGLLEEDLIKMDQYIHCPKLTERLSDLFTKREYWRNRKKLEKTKESERFPDGIHMESTCTPPLNYTKQDYTKQDNTIPDEIISEEDMNFVEELLQIFCDEYKNSKGYDYELITGASGRDMKGVGMLLKHYRIKNPNSDTDKCREDFRLMFRACMNVPDNFLRDKVSPMMIASQYNNYKTSLRGNNGKRVGATQQDLTDVVNNF